MNLGRKWFFLGGVWEGVKAGLKGAIEEWVEKMQTPS